MDICSVVEAGGKEDTHCDEQLVCANQSTTNPRRCCLSLVHGHQKRQSPHAQSSYQTSNHNLIPRCTRSNLDDEANTTNKAPNADRKTSSDSICQRSCGQSADERTNRKQSNNQTRSNVAEVIFTVTAVLAEASQEIWHFEEARDLTSIISEAILSLACLRPLHRGVHSHETTHGHKHSHSKRPPRHQRQRGVIQFRQGASDISALFRVWIVLVEVDGHARLAWFLHDGQRRG